MDSEKIQLQDLPILIKGCQEKYESLNFKADIFLNSQFKILLEKNLNIGEKIIVHDYSIELTSPTDLKKAFLPSSILWIAYCFWPYDKELRKYDAAMKLLVKNLEKEKAITTSDVWSLYLSKLPPSKPEDNPSQEKRTDIETSISKIFPNNTNNQEYLKKFIFDRSWWFPDNTTGKKLGRGDVYESSIIPATKIIVATSAKVMDIIKSFTDSKALRDGFEALNKTPITQTDCTSNITGQNKIYYGAPGTGKSYDIEKLIPREQNIRTVFHADTQYGDFVGCLKPTMKNGTIEYSFAPGPFTTAIIEALNKPDEHIYLTIEEINRAPAASVFGDIFQLLDRDKTGKSAYSIDITDRDWLNYLNEKLNIKLQSSQLSIPSNLSIYATMNSSDQAVMPLDTAFKRRWLFEYKSLDFDQSNIPHGYIPLASNSSSVPWAKLAVAINSCLTDHNIPEDRLLGPWFVTEKEINTPEKALATLTGKILNYIWDDVLRHQQRNIIFRSDLKTFAQVCDEINSGKNIYSDSLNTKLDTL